MLVAEISAIAIQKRVLACLLRWTGKTLDSCVRFLERRARFRVDQVPLGWPKRRRSIFDDFAQRYDFLRQDYTKTDVGAEQKHRQSESFEEE